MKSDYDVGDVVECVDLGILHCKNAYHDGTGSNLKLGGVYRVERFGTSQDFLPYDVDCGCLCAGVGQGRSGHHARFKKLKRADDAFIRVLRARKPEPVA